VPLVILSLRPQQRHNFGRLVSGFVQITSY
jgi:hypothetical protein